MSFLSVMLLYFEIVIHGTPGGILCNTLYVCMCVYVQQHPSPGHDCYLWPLWDTYYSNHFNVKNIPKLIKLIFHFFNHILDDWKII